MDISHISQTEGLGPRSSEKIPNIEILGVLPRTWFAQPNVKNFTCIGQTSGEEIASTAPTSKFLGTAEAYFVCHIGPTLQISLIYAFIGCP